MRDYLIVYGGFISFYLHVKLWLINRGHIFQFDDGAKSCKLNYLMELSHEYQRIFLFLAKNKPLEMSFLASFI